MERQKKKESPITDIIRHSVEKVGINFPADKRRVSRQMLTDMNVAQLQIIVNDFHTQIESLNEQLVKFLMDRDDLHMSQGKMSCRFRHVPGISVMSFQNDFEFLFHRLNVGGYRRFDPIFVSCHPQTSSHIACLRCVHLMFLSFLFIFSMFTVCRSYTIHVSLVSVLSFPSVFNFIVFASVFFSFLFLLQFDRGAKKEPHTFRTTKKFHSMKSPKFQTRPPSSQSNQQKPTNY